MSSIQRRKDIMRTLHEKESESISALAEKFDVSSMTVRRDLASLRDEGLITIEQGVAYLNKGSLFEYSVQLKIGERGAEKRKIAQKCLDYIKEGDSVFIDAGTTAGEIAKFMEDKQNVMVITNSLYASNFLSKVQGINLIMCPGEYRDTSMAFIGPLTSEFVSKFKIDTLFLAVEGIDAAAGLSAQSVYDGMTKAALIKAAKKVICVADSTKFGKSYLYSFASLEDVDAIITDSEISEETEREIRKKTKIFKV